MTDSTVTRAHLAEAVCQEVGLPRSDAGDLVDAVLEEIIQAFLRNEGVKLSSFGAFQIRNKKQRMGRNPKTGEEVPITPRRVLTFHASHVLKDKINAALTTDSPHKGDAA